MLDANAAVPLYAQLEQKIESQIANRALHPGDRLPTEAQLARENGVSVITVRKAIDGLVRKGLLECKQGKGTFVSHHKLQRNMKKLQSFSDMCRQMGMNPGARMVENHLVPASAPTAATSRSCILCFPATTRRTTSRCSTKRPRNASRTPV